MIQEKWRKIKKWCFSSTVPNSYSPPFHPPLSHTVTLTFTRTRPHWSAAVAFVESSWDFSGAQERKTVKVCAWPDSPKEVYGDPKPSSEGRTMLGVSAVVGWPDDAQRKDSGRRSQMQAVLLSLTAPSRPLPSCRSAQQPHQRFSFALHKGTLLILS